MPITFLDILLGVALLFCVLLGAARGLIRALVSIGCCVFTGACIAILASAGVSFASPSEKVALAVGYYGILLIAFIVAAKIVHRMLDRRIATIDQVLGVFLGLARGVLLIALPLLSLDYLLPSGKEPEWVRNALSFSLLSMLSQVVVPGSDAASKVLLGGAIFHSIIIPSTVADFVAAVSRRWRLRRLDRKLSDPTPSVVTS